MQSEIVASAFGPRALTLAHLATQRRVRQTDPEARVQKWRVLQHVVRARGRLGLTERALAVLNALLSFHPDETLAPGAIAYPSNEQLCRRAHGMAGSTLRRHLARLVEAGLLLRRDSPNGKRYARRPGQGAAEIYGFDLTPLVARAGEFARLAAEVEAQEQALKALRAQMTLLRRDLGKIVAAGLEAAPAAADWSDVHARLRALVAHLPRRPDAATLRPLVETLSTLREEALDLLHSAVHSEDSDANGAHFRRHIQDSKTDTSPEHEPDVQGRSGPIAPHLPTGEAARREPAQTSDAARGDERPPAGFPLGLILRACPDIADYARGGRIDGWPGLVEAAAVARAALGISPHAYAEACDRLGLHDAAIVVACILQRSERIASAGGYLRALTRRAAEGRFSVGPMVMALLADAGPKRRAG